MARYTQIGEPGRGQCFKCGKNRVVDRYNVEYESYESGPPVAFFCSACSTQIVQTVKEPRTVDVAVLLPGGKQTSLGWAQNMRHEKITRSRALMCYGVHYLRIALEQIENATPKTMPAAIDRMRKQIETVAQHWHEALVQYGDTDPRKVHNEIWPRCDGTVREYNGKPKPRDQATGRKEA